MEHARRSARRLLEWFAVEAATDINVEGFARQLAIDIVTAQLDGATAQLVVGLGHASIYLSDRLTDLVERRWAIAHELGHFVLNHPSPPLEALLGPDPRHRLSTLSVEEGQADCFALELLMPELLVRANHNPIPMTLVAPMNAARAYRVSVEAAAIRLIELTEQCCAAVLSDRSGIRWVAPSRRFSDALGRALAEGRALDPRALATRCFARSADSEGPAVVAAEGWLVVPHELALLEHSIPGTQPGTVLTMLHVSDHVSLH